MPPTALSSSTSASCVLTVEAPRHYKDASAYSLAVHAATEALTQVIASSSALGSGDCGAKQVGDKENNPSIVGIDAEWTTRDVDVVVASVSPATSESAAPKKKKRTVSKVALLQLALPSFVTVCIRLHPSLFVEDATSNSTHLLCALEGVLMSAAIVKSGVGVDNDVKKLHQDWGIVTRSWVDLCGLQAVIPRSVVEERCAAKGGPTMTPVPRSLRDLASVWLKRELGKSLDIALSDWADMSVPLSKEQLAYAVGDAEASRDVAVAMLECSARYSTATSEASGNVNHWLQLSLERSVLELTKKRNDYVSCGKSGKASQSSAGLTASQVERAASWLEVRKKAYYDNIMTFDPNGELLFTIDKKKAEWYVDKKGLGKVTQFRRLADDVLVAACDMPIDAQTGMMVAPDANLYCVAAVQLTFTPDFERFNDTHIRRDLEYFRQPKDNKCVVCGAPDKVIRCAVVPLMYRKYFPKTYVSHNSYDLLLVCPGCFVKVNYAHDREREAIALEYNFPLATNQKPMLHRVADTTTGSSTASTASPGSLSAFEFTRQSRHIVHQVVKFASALLRNLRATVALPSGAASVENSEPRSESVRAPSSNPRASKKPSANSEAQAMKHAAWIPLEKIAAMEAFVVENAPMYSGFGLSLIGTSPLTREELLAECTLEKLSSADVHHVVSAAVAAKFPQVASAVDPSSPFDKKNATTISSEVTPPLRVDNHAAYVVSQVLLKYPGNSDAGVGEFILRWRNLFVEKLKPEHLPTGWRVDDGIVLP